MVFFFKSELLIASIFSAEAFPCVPLLAEVSFILTRVTGRSQVLFCEGSLLSW